MPSLTYGTNKSFPRLKLDCDSNVFKLEETVLLAFPDPVQLAGFRATLNLLETLSAGDSTPLPDPHIGTWEEKPEISVSSHLLDRYQKGSPLDLCECSILFFNPVSTGSTKISVCVIKDIPMPNKIPGMVDALLEVFTTNGAKKIVAPCSCIASGLLKESVHQISDSSLSNISLPSLPANAQTSDTFFVSLSILTPLTDLNYVLLMHPDKWPAVTRVRKFVPFGSGPGKFGDTDVSLMIGMLSEIKGHSIHVIVLIN
ncbi:hypothetical protein H4219_000255 [Mycoemilia scoparia]|uniref:Uncharacterized protein n=1 Tax=Mycoemilia scoparia TaxID=417184 RepID=A0A9W8DX34_9FUNG|nr:hypothetical protein H4219_000255 [Mycoemilia scoparia]